MKGWPLAALAIVLVAGCAGTEPATTTTTPATAVPVTDLDFIVPGHWTVSNLTDATMAWIHNTAPHRIAFSWTMTLAGGAPLPKDWTVSFSPAGGALEALGTKRLTNGRYLYDDWGRTMVTLRLPDNATAGDVPIELHAGGGTRAAVLGIGAERLRISRLGDTVNTHFDLRGQDGARLQEADFCILLGSQNAVPGYSFGAVGLAPGETVTLVVPPPFAYGYDQGDLQGQTLYWTVRVVQFLNACPPS
ncbi:MAG: FKBP-type peptidyl-prolyl cis-trans isomerase [bacterium]